jgi:hypothetical protein
MNTEMMSADGTREKRPRRGSLGVAAGSALVTVGSVGRFKPLKPGKIHLKCSRCKNTRSNMARSDFDPANAAVMVLNYCPRCDRGGGFEETTYYDANGKEIFC